MRLRLGAERRDLSVDLDDYVAEDRNVHAPFHD